MDFRYEVTLAALPVHRLPPGVPFRESKFLTNESYIDTTCPPQFNTLSRIGNKLNLGQMGSLHFQKYRSY